MRVYPIGYSTPGAQERINELLGNPKTLLIDTRIKPSSWNEDWRKEALEQRYGNQYHWAGRYLGNAALGTGRIEIADPDTGILGLMMYLGQGYDLILLCQCKVYIDCHVSEVVRLLLEKMPEVEVVRFEQQEGEMIKAISICQPYATWLANPQRFIAENLTPKRIENRNWTTNYRGPILIHASKKFEDDAIPCWLSRMPGIKRAVSLEKKDYPLGCIVGEAELSEVITILDGAKAENPWFCGEYGFVLKNAKPLDPIPYRGALKLFDVTRSVLEQPAQALPEAQTQEPERIIICQRPGKGKGCTMTWAVGDRCFFNEASGIVTQTKMEGLTQYVKVKLAMDAPLLGRKLVSDHPKWINGELLKPRGTIIPEFGERNE